MKKKYRELCQPVPTKRIDNSLFIYNIPKWFNIASFLTLLSKFGRIVRFSYGAGARFGFFDFDSKDDEQVAKSILNGFVIGSRRLVVDVAKERLPNVEGRDYLSEDEVIHVLPSKKWERKEQTISIIKWPSSTLQPSRISPLIIHKLSEALGEYFMKQRATQDPSPFGVSPPSYPGGSITYSPSSIPFLGPFSQFQPPYHSQFQHGDASLRKDCSWMQLAHPRSRERHDSHPSSVPDFPYANTSSSVPHTLVSSSSGSIDSFESDRSFSYQSSFGHLSTFNPVSQGDSQQHPTVAVTRGRFPSAPVDLHQPP
ncbi:hypothetical protein ADUPG1_012098, partial [Aduncisulcus paluster]